MSSLSIGPQYYPRRRFGAQVIARGPHGLRFGKNPIGDTRSGFHWWSEQITGDRWMPRQEVVGVMGLDGLGDVSQLAACSVPTPAIKAPIDPRSPARAVYAEISNALQAACHGRIEAAKHAIRGARYFLNNVPPSEEVTWSQEIDKAEAYVLRMKDGARVRLAEQQAKEAAHAKAQAEWDKAHGETARQITREEIEAAKRGKFAYAAYLAKTDPAATLRAAGPSVVSPAWGLVEMATGKRLLDPQWKTTKEKAESRDRGECDPLDIACHVGKHWWKVALAIGGVALLYGAGSGIARGAVRKVL